MDRFSPVRRHRYQEAVAQLRCFSADHPGASVPQHFVTADGFRLGTWCANRRAQRRRGELSEQRVAELTSAGMVWDPRGPHDERYRRALSELAKFSAERPGVAVRRDFVSASGFPLGIWCMNRRAERRRGDLAQQRVAELTAAGMVWEPRLQKMARHRESLTRRSSLTAAT